MKLRLSHDTIALGIDSFFLYFTWAIPLIGFICNLIPPFAAIAFNPLVFWCWIIFVSFSPLVFRNASIGMMITGVRIVDENGRCPAPKYIILRSSSLFSNVVENMLLMLSGKDIDGVGLTTSGTQVMSTKDIEEKRKQTENRLLSYSTSIPTKAKIPRSYTAPILKIAVALFSLPASIITAGILLNLIHQTVADGTEIPRVFEYILEIVCVPISFISALLLIRGIAEIMFIRDERRNLPSPEEFEKIETERCKVIGNKDERVGFCTDASAEDNTYPDAGAEHQLDCRMVDYKRPLDEDSEVHEAGDSRREESETERSTPFKRLERKFFTPDKMLTSYKYPLLRLAIFYGIMGIYALLFSLLWQITRLGSDVAITVFLIMFPIMFILIYCEARLLIRIIIEMVSVWKNKRVEKRASLGTSEDGKDTPEND